MTMNITLEVIFLQKRTVLQQNYNNKILYLYNFQPILTNEVSKSRLEFYLFNGISFVDISIFKAELFVFKFVSIFLGHPVLNITVFWNFT